MYVYTALIRQDSNVCCWSSIYSYIPWARNYYRSYREICLHERNQEDGSGCCHCKRFRPVRPELRGFTIQLNFIHAVCCLVECHRTFSSQHRDNFHLFVRIPCEINCICFLKGLVGREEELHAIPTCKISVRALRISSLRYSRLITRKIRERRGKKD